MLTRENTTGTHAVRPNPNLAHHSIQPDTRIGLQLDFMCLEVSMSTAPILPNSAKLYHSKGFNTAPT